MQTPDNSGTRGAARGFYNCPETPKPVVLSVVGQLPKWLSGVLYRTGPGTFSVPTTKSDKTFEFRHWFDGLTLHHRFEIKDGQVTYHSKRGATAVEEYIERTGNLPPGQTFGQTDPCESVLGRFFTKFKQTIKGEPEPQGPTALNIGVTFTSDFKGFSVGGSEDFVSKTDYNALQVLDRVTLEPLEIRSYSSILPELSGPLSAAHAGIGDGDFYNYNLSFGRSPSYKVFKINSAGQATILAEISDAPAAYLHSIFLTNRFVVLAVWQCDFKMDGLPILLYDALSVNTFKKWSDKRKSLFYVIDRHNGGVVGRYQTDPFFAFHSLNVFDDEDGSVVLDISCYEDNSVVNFLTLENLRSLGSDPSRQHGFEPRPRRFRLENIQFPTSGSPDAPPFLDAKVDFTLNLSSNIELPTVAPSVSNKPYRFVYGIHWESDDNPSVDGAFVNSIIKLDVATRTHKLWMDKSLMVPGEPIFVPCPSSDCEGELGEDSGVLLTVALDTSKGTSALVVIDAQTMLELARAEMTIPFPYGFHGTFTTQ